MGKDIEAYNAHSCDVCNKPPREAFDGSLRVTRCAEGKRLVKLADQELKLEQPERYEAKRKYWRDKRDSEKGQILREAMREQKREEIPGAVTVSVIEACPFAHEVFKGVVLADYNIVCFCFCDDCKTRGPDANTQQEAREKWNARRKV